MLRDTWAISGGLTVAPPTADDVNVVTADGTPLVQVLNRSTHLGPFLGLLWTPNDRWFAQGFLQYDVAANGNPVFINQGLTGAELANVGNLVDTPFQYVDIGVGYWAYRGHDRFHRLTGWAFTSELHWNRSLRESDVVQRGQLAHRRFRQHRRNFRPDARHAHRILRSDDHHLRLLPFPWAAAWIANSTANSA